MSPANDGHSTDMPSNSQCGSGPVFHGPGLLMSDVSASREMDCWRGTAARGSGSVVSNSSVS